MRSTRHLITTTLSALALVACVLAFTGCGGSNPDIQTLERVPEQKPCWVAEMSTKCLPDNRDIEYFMDYLIDVADLNEAREAVRAKVRVQATDRYATSIISSIMTDNMAYSSGNGRQLVERETKTIVEGMLDTGLRESGSYYEVYKKKSQPNDTLYKYYAAYELNLNEASMHLDKLNEGLVDDTKKQIVNVLKTQIEALEKK